MSSSLCRTRAKTETPSDVNAAQYTRWFFSSTRLPVASDDPPSLSVYYDVNLTYPQHDRDAFLISGHRQLGSPNPYLAIVDLKTCPVNMKDHEASASLSSRPHTNALAMAFDTTGNLNYYLAPSDGSRPYHNINADSVTGERARNWMEDAHDMRIENVRGKEELYKLDNAGFQFGREAAKHVSFSNDVEIEHEYYPESIDLIRKVTGASSVVIFDHTIRRHRPGQPDDSPERRQPVPLVHVDQTTASSIARVHRHLPPSEAPSLLRKRFQIINLWRPISHAALDWPLALCDFRSVDVKNDLLPVALIYPDREGETFGVQYNPDHQWKYMRGMTPEEFVLIKCFDSIQDGSVARLAPHTGFQDPNTPEGAPLRESIELRALVFYD